MNFKISIALGLFLTLASFSSASAQVKECPLDLSVTLYQKNEDASEIPISNASATAANIATKKVAKADLFEGMPRFPKLTEGRYDLTVRKDGYARTFKRIKVDCSGLADDGTLSEDIWLWKGSAEQTMRMRNVSIALTSKDNVPIASSEVKNTKAKLPPQNSISDGGILNGKAKVLAKPVYPAAARAVKATGAVNVQVTIDEQGNVISASAVSGHPLLRQAAEKAARDSSFAPTVLNGEPVKVTGIIVFNFVP